MTTTWRESRRGKGRRMRTPFLFSDRTETSSAASPVNGSPASSEAVAPAPASVGLVGGDVGCEEAGLGLGLVFGEFGSVLGGLVQGHFRDRFYFLKDKV